MTQITAFVTGAEHPTGLGSARALKKAGARVVGFTGWPRNGCCRSRAWDEVRALTSSDPAKVAAEILAVASKVPGPVFLLPTQDELVQELSGLQPDFPENLRAALPSQETVQLLLEKTRFAGWAEEKGFALPRSVVVDSQEGLSREIGRCKFPAILKPLVRTIEWQRVSPVEKVLQLSGRQDLKRVPFDLFDVAPSYVLSEWIPGDDSDVLFCLCYLDSESEVVAAFTGRKLLQYPRLTGSTAICVDHDDPELRALAGELFRASRCTGLASLEVKRSRETGEYLITEPTVGRPNLQSPVAFHGGINLVGIAMLAAWGRDYSWLIRSPRRAFWVEERAVFEILTTRTGVPVQVGLIGKEFLRHRRPFGAYFRLSDPWPFLALMKGWGVNGMRRLPGVRKTPELKES